MGTLRFFWAEFIKKKFVKRICHKKCLDIKTDFVFFIKI